MVEKSKTTERPKIMVCVPNTGAIYTTFMVKTLNPMSKALDWCDLKINCFAGPSVTVNRNALVNTALKEGADVCFLDSDMFFEKISPAAALKALYDMDVPFACGLARTKMGARGFPFAFWDKIDESHFRYWFEIPNWKTKEVDGVGMFFSLIRKQVFEALQPPYFSWNEGDKERDMGEDAFFCMKAQQAGFKPVVNTDVRLYHAGHYALGTDLSLLGLDELDLHLVD